ncbi:ABC transporter permease, partial [Candidatus Aerophobetes bacterium]
QYSLGDNFATFLAFVGLSIPSFFFALVIMYIMTVGFGAEAGGLFSQYYVLAPWSWAKFVDFLKHFWVPVLIVGFAGTARNMRVMRGNLLDVLNSQYVLTARSKGLKERVVIYKHAVVNALHPIIMYQGMVLPFIIQGEIAASIVLNLPTAGPMFYDALVAQDMYLAGSFLMLLSVVLIIGNLLADILLAWVDPRIRYK